MPVSVPSPQSMTSRAPSLVLWAVPLSAQEIVSGASEDHVPTHMALDPVIVLVPAEHILARADFEPVVAFVTINLVVPARSVDHVSSGAAHQPVVLVGTRAMPAHILFTANATPVASASTSAAVTDSNATRLTVPLLGRVFSLARTRGFCESG